MVEYVWPRDARGLISSTLLNLIGAACHEAIRGHPPQPGLVPQPPGHLTLHRRPCLAPGLRLRGDKGRAGAPASSDAAVAAVPARPASWRPASRSRHAADTPATGGPSPGPRPTPPWPLRETVRSHAAAGPSRPALPAGSPPAGCSGHMAAPRAAPGGRAPPPASPRGATHHASRANSVPRPPADAPPLWGPAASAWCATASGARSGAPHPPATGDWSPHAAAARRSRSAPPPPRVPAAPPSRPARADDPHRG
jgi:hypothetical protein